MRTLVLVWTLLSACRLAAVDFAGGEIHVLPVPNGGEIHVDGDPSEWNLHGREPAYIDSGTAAQLNTQWAFMADEEALYLFVESSLPGRGFQNPNDPHERFWQGDLLQLRLTSDPELGYPLNRDRDAASNRVAHISLWKNSLTGKDFIHIKFGTKFDQGTAVNPEGSQIRVVEEPGSRYLVEARIPWAALNVPGGKNPFGPDRPGTGVAETLWTGGGDASRTKLGFADDGGVFSFNRPHTWGRMIYPDRAPEKPLRPSMKEILAGFDAGGRSGKEATGVPITLEIPEKGLSASVNIFGPKGEIVREVFAGKDLPKGPMTVYWDGLDGLGQPAALGKYRWGAYLHGGLEAEFMGSVGMSGNPPYPTADGLGQWGGDHANPIAVTADDSGIYFLWPSAEAGRAIVKAGYDGRTIFRSTPFTGGGFGPFNALTVEGSHIYIIRGNKEVFVSRLDASTGRVEPWGEKELSEVHLFDANSKAVPLRDTPVGFPPTTKGRNPNMLPPVEEGWAYQPDCFGVAVLGNELFVSNFSGDRVRVFDLATLKPLRDLACVGPRGLLVHDGDLYAVSYVPGKPGAVVKFSKGKGEGETVVKDGLVAPFDVAIDPKGNLYVSDLGTSQQVKVFSAGGKQLGAIGAPGGRPWQGLYDPASPDLLQPAGLVVDRDGTLIVTESSPPKVFTRFSLPGHQVLQRWYGAPTYWASTFPMPDDPKNVFYMLSYALGRGRVAGPDKVGVPNAYWQPNRAGFPDTENIEGMIPFPQVLKGTNGRLYLAKDSGFRDIYVFEENETLRPVAQFRFLRDIDEDNPLKKGHFRIWMDENGDGLQQEDEIHVVTELGDGSPLPPVNNSGKSMSFFPNGDVLIHTNANSILRIPSSGFGKDGTIDWKIDAIETAIPNVWPGLAMHGRHHRAGALGVARNSKGEYYVPFNARLKGGGGPWDYPDAETAESMLRGMGHSSTTNAVKFIKFDPQGQMLWMAGRKALAGAKPGEIYHFWNLAGLVGDEYVAGGSEWGTVAFYTHDGFYVDTIFNNPAMALPAGPLTFGGETSGASVFYFPALDEVWAYNTARTFRVRGFQNGRVVGERRVFGEVALDRVHAVREATAQEAPPITISQTKKDLFVEDAGWTAVPESILTLDGNKLAEARFARDQKWLYGRITVQDSTPMENVTDQPQLAFKWGDSVSLVLGPQRDTKEPVPGDLRILVAEMDKKPLLVAMKPFTKGEKRPFEYTTPATGTVAFEFVDEIPGGKVRIDREKDSYTATFAVPIGFIETDLAPGSSLQGDLELRLSGPGPRGLQATRRAYIFTPANAATTMVDDIPLESKMHPEFWGPVKVP